MHVRTTQAQAKANRANGQRGAQSWLPGSIYFYLLIFLGFFLYFLLTLITLARKGPTGYSRAAPRQGLTAKT